MCGQITQQAPLSLPPVHAREWAVLQLRELCTNMGQSGDLSDDYMLRAALKGTHFFGEN